MVENRLSLVSLSVLCRFFDLLCRHTHTYFLTFLPTKKVFPQKFSSHFVVCKFHFSSEKEKPFFKMGRFTEQSESTGFIKDLFQKLQSSLNAEQVKNFANLEDDASRYKFISNNPVIKDFQITLYDKSIKNDDLANEYKLRGNREFQKKNWTASIESYNKGLLLMPPENAKEISILLANRSAALYHLEKFEHALEDIELAEENYPAEMMYKLKERTARCHLAKKSYEKALKAFMETITHLDESKLPMEKRGKLEKDAQIMIKMLPKQVEYEKKMNMNCAKKNANSSALSVTQLSKSVTFDYNENEGRFVKTNHEIKCGEEILVEQAICATLFEKFAKSHCQFCFARSITPLPCPNCIDVIFCSKKCRNAAIYTYHKFECGMLESIWSSGSSINCQMAMRLISQRPLSYYRSIRDQLKSDMSIEEMTKLPSHDYRRVYSMVCHDKMRPTYSYLQYSFMATFLVKILDANHYFDSDISGKTGDMCEDDRIFIGELILRNLQILQFNSHQVFDLLKSSKTGARQTVAIGAALYTTLCLFNHSCNPSIVRYFKNTTVHAISIRNMKPGEQVCENYGPLYSQNSRADRQKKLKDFYWFGCACEACQQNWPVYDEMNTNEIRFKCNGKKSCNNVIAIPSDCNEFMIKCIQCGEFTNILKGLKSVQDTEILEKTAKRLFNEGKMDEALRKYIDMMNIFDEVIAPPFQDYCKTQQAIKECLLEYGNRIQVE
ncbi:SET and MYND domain-containing protein 4-like [Contarinia nasturtii]|uniref:SET and MYND domain-containing protein 4-like n=1 Tax=Contarinia nasturtii TaxID=265458 RepID=UPI0012D3726C|nr:SET and MYND domain-containing protein 4-like [Contarinia nasturtii]